MALFRDNKKGETGNYYATFTPDEIAQRTENMFMTTDGGLHTFNGQIDDDLCSNKHDYSGDKNSMMASQWKYELQKQARLDAAKAQQEREIAEFQALKARGKVSLSMDEARLSKNNGILQNYNKETSEKIKNKTGGYVVSPKKETVEDILNDMSGTWDEAYKKPSVKDVGDKNVPLEKESILEDLC